MPRRRTFVDPRFPTRLQELREERGLSLRELGRLVPCAHVHIHQMEKGRSVPSRELAARLDDALDAGGELAALFISGHEPNGLDALAAGEPPPSANRMLAILRAELVARRWPQHPGDTAADPVETEAGVHALHHAYQRADYDQVGQLLPALVAASEHLAQHTSGQEQRRAHQVLAVANIAASKLAAKLGDGELAWITADRAASAAMLAGDRLVGAAAAYQAACALLRLSGRLGDAAEVVAVANDELNRSGKPSNPADLSARGALLLLGALVAARQGDHGATVRHLDGAGQLAAGLGHDGNHLYTAFGPTNLMIHHVSAAVELQRPGEAIQIGDQLDTSRMPPTLVSRRAQVHLDLASAYSQTPGGDSAAVLHLLEVERIAPQVVGVNHVSRELLVQLIGRERRSATPGLRGLAHRAGVLA